MNYLTFLDDTSKGFHGLWKQSDQMLREYPDGCALCTNCTNKIMLAGNSSGLVWGLFRLTSGPKKWISFDFTFYVLKNITEITKFRCGIEGISYFSEAPTQGNNILHHQSKQKTGPGLMVLMYEYYGTPNKLSPFIVFHIFAKLRAGELTALCIRH